MNTVRSTNHDQQAVCSISSSAQFPSTRKRLQVLFGILLLVVFGICLSQAWFQRDPVYQGRRLTALLEKAYQDGPNVIFTPAECPQLFEYSIAAHDAIKAITALGPRALPTLMAMMRTEDSALKLRLISLAKKQSVFQFRFSDAGHLHTLAAFGLFTLGNNASSAVPKLTDLFLKRGDSQTAMVLAKISPDGLLALSQVLTNANLMVNTNFPNLSRTIVSALEFRAAVAKGSPNNPQQAAWLKSAGEIMVPSLGQCLKDRGANPSGEPLRRQAAKLLLTLEGGSRQAALVMAESLTNSDAWVRVHACIDLAAMRTAASDAGPAILQALEDPDAFVRHMAVFALGLIKPSEPVATTALPILLGLLHDKSARVRAEAAMTLSRIAPLGTARERVIPALVTALRDPHPDVRSYAAMGLNGITPTGVSATPVVTALRDLLLHESNSRVRADAAKALENLQARGAAEPEVK